MAQPSSKIVLSLYRDFLRFSLKMKHDENRTGRNLREKLIDTLKDKFRANKNEADIEKIKELTSFGRLQLETLQKITTDELLKKVRIFEN